jgi:hypothetical protein
MTIINTRIKTLLAPLATMTDENPVLLEGELWTEKDELTGQSTGRRKVGDGVTEFVDLPFEPVASSGASIGLAAGLAIALG